MTLQSKLMKMHKELIKLDVDVYHYWRSGLKAPYVIWAEDSENNSMAADNQKKEQSVHGTIDCYTPKEFDPLLDDIQDALNEVCGSSWRLNTAEYEEETELIHYEWEFEVN